MDSLEPHTALFASLVMQQSNMAMLFLGQRPHPETGKPQVDLDTASLFIETLEMLAAKTKGNLSRPEQQILQQHLTAARLAFVEAADAKLEPVAGNASSATDTPPAAPAATAETAPPGPAGETPADQAAADDARKRFVKRY